jgi:hypothetical protein
MKKNTRGSALILVFIAVLILSIIGIAGLSSISNEMSTARNYVADKTAFYAADAGINFGLNLVRKEMYPPVVTFTQTKGNIEFRSGGLTYSTEQPVTAFTGFKVPQPIGISIEVGSETGAVINPWQLTVSSKVLNNNLKGFTRKELTVVFQSLSTEY